MNLRELARLAGLSVSGVSLALRNSPKISKRTQLRVRQLAQKHGYHPDAKIITLMRHLRRPVGARQTACFGVVSLYDEPRPWEASAHLNRIYEGMVRRARGLGYRLEPLWIRAPRLATSRFRDILDARGIEGLLCFGSPVLEDDFPRELDHYAVVTVGLSIRTPLHRVTSHFYNDTISALARLHELGYRRPGLVLGRYEDVRTAHMHVAAYLGWCEATWGSGHSLPVLRLDGVDETRFLPWWKKHQPDAVLFIHLPSALAEFQAVLQRNRIRVPGDLGVAVLTHILDGRRFSGLQQNQDLMGAWAVELLAARVANHDLGIPSSPRIEMVESEWIEGRSLRSKLVRG